MNQDLLLTINRIYLPYFEQDFHQQHTRMYLRIDLAPNITSKYSNAIARILRSTTYPWSTYERTTSTPAPPSDPGYSGAYTKLPTCSGAKTLGEVNSFHLFLRPFLSRMHLHPTCINCLYIKELGLAIVQLIASNC